MTSSQGMDQFFENLSHANKRKMLIGGITGLFYQDTTSFLQIAMTGLGDEANNVGKYEFYLLPSTLKANIFSFFDVIYICKYFRSLCREWFLATEYSPQWYVFFVFFFVFKE